MRGRRSIISQGWARAVTALSQGQLFSRLELRGRRSVFPSSNTGFVAGASLSQGQVQISWQARHFRKVKYTKVVREVKKGTFKYESSTRSPLSQPGLENRNF